MAFLEKHTNISLSHNLQHVHSSWNTAMAAVHLSFIIFFFLSFSSSSDTESLLRLKTSLTNADHSLSSWIPNVSPCSGTWHGVVCFDNVITGLHLADLGLSGPIDIDALAEIRGLRTLSFINNAFSGPIPSFNKLGSIKSLLLSRNHFSGTIPDDFFSSLNSLKKLYLSENNFTGTIPQSLTELELLIELHLESNSFSGPVPSFKQHLKSFDLSNNKLQGPIPESLANVQVSSFTGNEGLCGKPLDNPCDPHPSYTLQVTTTNGSCDVNKEEIYGSSWAGRVILVLVLATMAALMFLFVKRRRKRMDFRLMGRSNRAEEVLTVQVPHVRSSAGDRKERKNKRGEIVMVNKDRGVFGLQDLMKASAEVLGSGGLGSAYKAAMGMGLCVVVKRMKEMNKIGKDLFDAEMRHFGMIRHRNIMTPLAYLYRREEKLFIVEYMPKGSLMYVLHGDRGISHSELTWPTRLNIVKGIGRGLEFLYSEFCSYELPHGNLKSSNVLLTDEYEPVLSDYGYEPLINPSVVAEALFAFKSPDYIHSQKVSQKTDVYCLGIIVLEIITGKLPAQYHSNGKGGTNVVKWALTAISEGTEEELIDMELQNDENSRKNMLQLLHVGASCAESNPEQRPDMKEAIRRIEEVQV